MKEEDSLSLSLSSSLCTGKGEAGLKSCFKLRRCRYFGLKERCCKCSRTDTSTRWVNYGEDIPVPISIDTVPKNYLQ